MREREQHRALRRVSGAGIVALVALALSACVQVNQTSTIKTDFTGTTTMRIGIAKQALAQFATLAAIGGTQTPSQKATTAAGINDPFADAKKQVTQLGGTSKDYETKDFKGIDASFTFKTLDEMQRQINTMLGASSTTSLSPTGSAGSSVTGGLVTVTAKQTTSGARIDGKVDPSLNSGGTATPGLDPKTLSGGVDGTIDLAFTMPGKILNADTLAKKDKSTVSWHFKVGDQPATIFVESDKSGGQSGSAVASTSGSNNRKTGVIVGIILALLVIGGLTAFFILRNRRRRPAPAAPFPGAVPYGTPNQYGPPQGNPYGQPPPQQ